MEKLTEVVAEASAIVREHIDSISSDCSHLLQLCESPVEQIFLAATIQYFDLKYNEHFRWGQAVFSADSPFADGIFRLLVEPQAEIDCYEAKYRADFLFSLWRHASGGKPLLWGKTVVEIDGHEFHEKTKQQASRDKKRDRTLLSEGYLSLRFSGSDVFNDPFGAAEEVHFHMDRCAHEVVASFEKQGKLSELLWGAS